MSQNKKKKPSTLFRIVRWLVWLFYPKIKIVGTENLPDEPCIIVGNHAQMNGPIIGEIHFPGKRLIWCVGDMLHLRDVPLYAFQDFWSEKPKWTHWFYKIASYIIAPLSVFLMSNARTIGVYHDTRILSTFKATVAGLKDKANIIIFPEHNVKYNHILYEFTTGFVEVARLYYKKTGREVSFVPMYNAPKLKGTYLGKPIKFNAMNPIEEEKKRISEYLMNEITAIAESLPEHTVIPYRNIPKKYYPSNKGGSENEKTCS